MKILSEYAHFVKGLDPVADAFAGTVTSDIVNCENFSRVTFVIYTGVGVTGTSTLTVEACDDVSATNTTAIPFRYREITTGDTPGTLTDAAAAGYVTTAGSSKIILVEVDTQELGDTGYGYVRLKAVESVDSPVLGGILIIMHGNRFAQAIQGTAIV